METMKWRIMKYEPLLNYESRYLINILGQIESIERVSMSTGRQKIINIKKVVLKIQTHKQGYLYYRLWDGLKYKNYFIHRLLCVQFVPNPENKPYVNHKDGNKLNNNIENLEWCTSSENNSHARKMGLNKGYGEGNRHSKLKEKQVIEIRKSNLTSMELSTIYGVTKRTIEDIIKGRTWKYMIVSEY